VIATFKATVFCLESPGLKTLFPFDASSRQTPYEVLKSQLYAKKTDLFVSTHSNCAQKYPYPFETFCSF
jgi:hypothetical protein